MLSWAAFYASHPFTMPGRVLPAITMYRTAIALLPTVWPQHAADQAHFVDTAETRSGVTGSTGSALRALARVQESRVACHAAYQLK